MRIPFRKLSSLFPAGEFMQCQHIRLRRAHTLPEKARVVVAGGGVAGLSVLYHLIKAGCKDVVLIEKLKIGHGVTKQCQGLFHGRHLWNHQQVQYLAKQSMALFHELSATYPEINLQFCKSLWIAKTPGSLLDLQRIYSNFVAYGLEAGWVSTDQLRKYETFMSINDLKGGLFTNDSATVDVEALVRALSTEATRLGAIIVEGCSVEEVQVDADRKVSGVKTSNGFVACQAFVNAAGIWAHVLSHNDVHIPLKLPMQAIAHSTMIAEPLKGSEMNESLIVRDYDANVYAFLRPDSTVASGFSVQASQPAPLPQLQLGDTLTSENWPEDWDHFLPVLEQLSKRFPTMAELKIKRLSSGYEGVTPDGEPLIGEVAGLDNYYVMSGFCGCGLSQAPGAGEVLATWVMRGQPDCDVGLLDVCRFLGLHANRKYLHDKAPEVMGLTCRLQPELHQMKVSRNIRMSPVHEALKHHGAVFGEIMGYERPLYYSASGGRGSEHYVSRDSHVGRPRWFDFVSREYEASRERVSVIDMSNFSKFEISGNPETLIPYLQYICSSDIDRPVGNTVYTGLQNEHGGYVTDCTLSRIAEDRFFIVAPTVQQVRTRKWLEKHRPKNSGVAVHDVTSMYTAFNIIGPASRSLMTDLTGLPMDNSSFPMFSCRELDVAYTSNVKAISVTHCGELGWVLYVPNEFAQHVHDQIVQFGKEYGLRHAGYYCLRHLRIEKFYVYWGIDIDYMTTPLECGRAFRISFDKEDFIGKKALLKQRDEGVTIRYVQVLLENHDLDNDPWPQGQEPIFRNGVFVGFTTSACYGFTLGCQVCLGYVEHMEDGKLLEVTSSWISDKEASYEVMIANKRFPATVHMHSPQLPMSSSEHPKHFMPTQ